jgi:hypothetical protein
MSPAPPLRPVWVVPAVVAALGIVVVVLIAVVHRANDRAPGVAATSTTTAPPARPTSTAVPRDSSAAAGSRANPFPVGTAGPVGGWTITVESASVQGSALNASVRVEWDGTATATVGDPTDLSLRIDDATGEHELGGTGCTGDPAAALAAVPHLDVRTSDTVALCWSVTGLDLPNSVLAVRSATASQPTYLSVS